MRYVLTKTPHKCYICEKKIEANTVCIQSGNARMPKHRYNDIGEGGHYYFFFYHVECMPVKYGADWQKIIRNKPPTPKTALDFLAEKLKAEKKKEKEDKKEKTILN